MEYYHIQGDSVEIVKTKNINKQFGVHNHTRHYVVSLVMKGKVQAYLSGAWKTYSSDDFFIVSPLEPHSVNMKEKAQLVSLCIDKSMIDGHNSFETEAFLRKLLHEAVQNNILSREECECFCKALRMIYELYSGKVSEIEDDMKILTGKIIDFPEKSITLNRMSQECYISKYHLIRKFKNSIGLTPHQFHIQSRIRKAQHLLREGASVVEASLKMGFYDQSHFDKYFQKIVGISPKEYIASEKCIQNML